MVSCSPEERSYESVNGWFTESLIEGFDKLADENHDGQITIRELFDYSYVKTKEKSKGSQHPVFFGSLNQNIVVNNLFPQSAGRRRWRIANSELWI